jgi:hypothetical protein
MASQQATLESLAGNIAELTKSITSYLKAEGLPAPSFAADAPAEYPAAPEITGPRLMLVQALMDMLHLAMGSKDFVLMQSLTACPPISTL